MESLEAISSKPKSQIYSNKFSENIRDSSGVSNSFLGVSWIYLPRCVESIRYFPIEAMILPRLLGGSDEGASALYRCLCLKISCLFSIFSNLFASATTNNTSEHNWVCGIVLSEERLQTPGCWRSRKPFSAAAHADACSTFRSGS